MRIWANKGHAEKNKVKTQYSKEITITQKPGFHGGMVDRLSSKVDEEVSGSFKVKEGPYGSSTKVSL